jgi:hypothetical protein
MLAHMTTITLSSKYSMNGWSHPFALLLIPLTLACFAVSPTARAVSPPPDGGYAGWNTAEGQDALFSNVTGGFNSAIGGDALYANTTGSANTAVGAFSLTANSSGFQNVAVGQGALRYNTTGYNNAASGFQALYFNTMGAANTASGYKALFKNTIGNDNTATGAGALQNNTTASNNTATGVSALYSNTTGTRNTGNGFSALFSNTTGDDNTADGYNSLLKNTSGTANTAYGATALFSNTTGLANTATGSGALYTNTTGYGNTAVGNEALNNNTIGSQNIAIGILAALNLTTGNFNIDIGSQGVAGDSGTIRLGDPGFQTATYIVGISGATVAGDPVVVNSNGQLGVAASSARFKEGIKAMDKTSEAILSLKPVTFRYKHELDPDGIPQFGLVAEEVEKVNPDLVARDEEGKPYTVRYEAVNAMLLNEFLKEHRKVQELDANAVRQQKQIEALTSGLQKVNAELELSKAAQETPLSYK